MRRRRHGRREVPAGERATVDLCLLETQIPRTLIERLGTAALPQGEELGRLIADEVHHRLIGTRVPLDERRRLIRTIQNEMSGLDVLQAFMERPEVTEIMVNGPEHVFIEEDGRIRPAGVRFRDREHLTDVIVHFFSRENRAINYWQPLADLRLPDGSRANAVLPPIAPDGPILTIRKFTGIRHEGPALLASGMLSAEALDFLYQAVRQRRTIMISGGTGTGKTTLLNVLSQAILPAERVVTIEDSAELQLVGRENLVRLECRPQGAEGQGEIAMSQLIRTALRMRPDRLIIGEVRGAEAYDLMVSLNTGHRGTLCTVHANTCRHLLPRLASLVLENSQLPYEAIRRELGAAIDYIVQIVRESDGRRLVQEICRVEQAADGFESLETVFLRKEGQDA
ncbi:MAG: ATPase, T2SS/T4P/T4SS family, partial [Bacillota bacterium]|nr:ATPase, T2SS/T4P/T4SS family [Bacillota bacterium]